VLVGRPITRALFLSLAAISLALLTCVGASAANSPAQIVTCTGFSGCFSPNPIQIQAGSTVTWTNSTSLTHTATSDTGAWDTGNIASGGTSASITFNQPGTFSYHCTIHPTMRGSIIVTAAATASPTAEPTAPVVRRLASGGGGPWPLLGLLALLVGLGLLGSGWLRAQRLDPK
jgi:plastocyanin